MDGQPVDPSRWAQDNPYEPVVNKTQKANGKSYWTALEDYQGIGAFLPARPVTKGPAMFWLRWTPQQKLGKTPIIV